MWFSCPPITQGAGSIQGRKPRGPHSAESFVCGAGHCSDASLHVSGVHGVLGLCRHDRRPFDLSGGVLSLCPGAVLHRPRHAQIPPAEARALRGSEALFSGTIYVSSLIFFFSGGAAHEKIGLPQKGFLFFFCQGY